MVELIALLQVLQSKPKVILPDPVIIQEYQSIDKTMIWPGVGEIDPDDLPDDGTGRSGSDVMDRDDDSTEPLVISSESVSVESHSGSQESVPEVSQSVSQESVPDDSQSFSQDSVPVDSQSVSQESAPDEPQSVSQESVPEESQSVSQNSDSVESQSVSLESDSVAYITEITDSSDLDYSAGFQVFIFAIGFVAGAIVTFALFKHLRSR